MDEEGGRPDVHILTYIERQVRVRAPIVDIRTRIIIIIIMKIRKNSESRILHFFYWCA